MPDLAPLRAGSQLGRFVLHRRIGAGGMAEVWEASEEASESPEKLAVKVLRDSLAKKENFRAMFRDEAMVGTKLRHPHILGAGPLGAQDGRLFFSMTLVDGESLHRVIQHQTPAWPVATRVVRDVAEALWFAHEGWGENGATDTVVHRDISPDNILLEKNGHVWLADFGIARANDREVQTRTGVRKGKLSYMSPEQVRGDKVGPLSDVYSLGLVLWEMVSGERLSEKTAAHTRDRTMASDDQVFLSAVPDGLCSFVSQMVEPGTSARVQSMRTVADRLTELLYLHSSPDKFSAEEVSRLVLSAKAAQPGTNVL